MQAPAIGRIVLINFGTDGDRPMLILKVLDENTVNGRVFLDGFNDRDIAKNYGMRTADDIWMQAVVRGKGPLKWRFYDD